MADLDGDGFDEYIVKVPQAGTNSALRVYDNDFHRIFFQKNFTSELLDVSTYSISDSNYILIIEKTDESINLLIVDYLTGANTLSFMPIYTLRRQSVDVSANNLQFFDLNNDGFPEVFLSFSSGLDAEIRALWAIDVKNKIILWKYDVAPNIRYQKVVILDSFKEPIILVSTQSPGNGYTINGMNDSKSYAIVLNALTGNLIYLKELGGWPSFTYLDTFNRAGENWLYSFTAGQSPGADGLGSLKIWNPSDFSVANQFSNILPGELILCADLDNNGADEFIRSGHDHRIDIYDSNLNLSDSYELPGIQNVVSFLWDLNGDQKTELVSWSDKSLLNVADYNGNILASIKCEYGDVFPVRKRNSITTNIGLLSHRTNTYYEYSLIPNTVFESNRKQELILGFTFGIIFSFIIILLIWILNRPKWLLRSNYTIFNSLKAAVLISDLSGRIKYLNSSMSAIVNIDENDFKYRSLDIVFSKLGIDYSLAKWMDEGLKQPVEFESLSGSAEQSKKHLVRIRPMSVRNRVFGLLIVAEDMSNTINFNRSFTYTAMAQRMVHEIKNPLTTVKLTLQRLKMEYDGDSKSVKYNEYVDSILEEVLRLRNVAENFLKFFKTDHPTFKSINVSELMKEIVRQYQIIDSDIFNISIKDDPGSFTIDMDQSQIEIMIKNVIDNAIKAVGKNGKIEIRLYETEKQNNGKFENYIVIVVEDNGCGIEDAKLDSIFKPYISANEDGTGLGLSIVKKIVSVHRGDISILSKPEIGTAVTIELPVKQKVLQ